MSATPQSLFPANPTTIRAQSTKLSVDPKGENVVYCQNRTVIIRSLNDASKPAIAYSQHPHPTTVARISPTGFYCASADQSGTVRVWDLVGDEQILKNETKVIAGRIHDLVWDGESKRIIAVGDGKECYGRAFLFDSGSSCGEITGHSRPINAVAIRKDRPFRAVTASDDNALVFYHGTPYKYNKLINNHSRFVQDVSYSPSGDHFVSVGSDSKVFVYDGKTGDLVSELSAQVSGHSGTIFAVDFAPDSKRIATCGADGFVKVWDVLSEKVVETYDLNSPNGDKVDGQQVGVTWAGNDRIVSLSFNGDLNVLSGGKVEKLYGACKSFGVGALEVAQNGKTLVGGCYDGRILSWSTETGICKPIQGISHSNAVLGISSTGTSLVSIGMDDSVRRIVNGQFEGGVISTTGQPRSVASCSVNGITVIAVPSGIDIINKDSNSSKTHHSLSYIPSCVAISSDGSVIAIGSQDTKVYLYRFDGSKLSQQPSTIFTNGRSQITALTFDPTNDLLASGESNGKILVYKISTQSIYLNQWVFHSGRINSIRFSPNGNHAVSGSLDTNVYIWSVLKPMKNIAIKNVHAGGVQSVVWINDSLIASSGSDGCIRTFTIQPHQGT